MIRHMFKLIWNRKRRNMLLMIEILVSFLVLFGITATMAGWGMQWLDPIGFNPDDLWVMQVEWEDKVVGQTREQVREMLRRIESEMLAYEEIENIAWCYNNTPYGDAVWRSDVEIDGREIAFDVMPCTDEYVNVLGINLVEGTWFGPEHDALLAKPVVVDLSLAKNVFGDSSAIGQTIADTHKEYFIVGVIDCYRYRGEFIDQYPQMFQRLSLTSDANVPPNRAVVRVRPGTGVAFENNLAKYVNGMVPSWSIRIDNIAELRSEYIKDKYLGLLIPAVIGFFLIINVALGLFGVLWYSINRRRSEIGLRRALGASAILVNRQILGEALVLATFALIVGVVLAIQVPVLGLMGPEISPGAYLLAILTSAVVIYLLVGLCAWYPARLAGHIHPAQALHDE
ncbi:MAG TPA: ABC transporter permease [candidate division Zixibacteria bacterium]|nr:ABC transporter permease [candidate division Zixibacteria bacterium]